MRCTSSTILLVGFGGVTGAGAVVCFNTTAVDVGFGGMVVGVGVGVGLVIGCNAPVGALSVNLGLCPMDNMGTKATLALFALGFFLGVEVLQFAVKSAMILGIVAVVTLLLMLLCC